MNLNQKVNDEIEDNFWGETAQSLGQKRETASYALFPFHYGDILT